MAKLTTTTYAILGLLARQPWSAYELTKYMQHSGIRAVWPRTESRIYLEFKNLVSHELATGKEETKQGRKRTVYTITQAGQNTLTQWLQSPEGALRLESEPLLKLLYSDLDKTAPSIQLDHMRQQVIEEIQIMKQEMAMVIEEGFAFETNAPHNADLLKLLTRLIEARVDWLLEISAVNPAKGSKQSTQTAKAVYQEQTAKLDQLLEKLHA